MTELDELVDDDAVVHSGISPPPTSASRCGSFASCDGVTGRLVEDFVADINYDWPWLVAPAHPDGIGRTGPD